MRIEDFVAEIHRLENWCKRLTDEQKDLLYEQVKNIPAAAFREIVSGFIESLRPGSHFPSVRDFKEAWIEYLSSHPEMQAWKYESEFCDECSGKGYFVVVYKRVPLERGIVEYTTLFACAKCNNWKKIWGKRPKRLWTRAEIEDHPHFYLKEGISRKA